METFENYMRPVTLVGIVYAVCWANGEPTIPPSFLLFLAFIQLIATVGSDWLRDRAFFPRMWAWIRTRVRARWSAWSARIWVHRVRVHLAARLTRLAVWLAQ